MSSVSHDMRTPLGAISASATSLSQFGDELAQETRADLLAIIVEQCGRLDRYTANLLNLTRLQAGLDASHFVTCDAVEVLGSAISRARDFSGEHLITKRFAAGSAIVRADPVMLEQVFYNVLENAMRYSSPKSEITVGVMALAATVEISIQDEGPGIPDNDILHVFQRFYRGTKVPTAEGSGLGLSIAKGFTEAFGGRIEAENSDFAGACIRILLPLDEVLSA